MRHGGTHWIRARYAIVGAASTLVLASCSLVLDANAPQCSTTDDCVARGPAFEATTCVESHCAAKPPVTALSLVDAGAPEAPYDLADPWRCVGRVNWPAATNEPIIDHEVFSSVLDGRAVPGLSVETCGRADVECASPLATVVTDGAGAAAIPITKGFAGYLQLKTPPASFPNLMPVIAPYIYPPGADPGALSQICMACGPSGAAMLVSKNEAAALAASVGTVLDPSRGLLLASVGDCDNHTRAGLQLEIAEADTKTKRYYFQDGLPSTVATATSETGLAGFVNVPPGVVSVKSRLVSTGKVIGARAVLVRAGTITIFFLPPTPP